MSRSNHYEREIQDTQVRAQSDRQLDDDVAFQKPFTKEEQSRMLMDTDEMSTRECYVATCRSMLKSVRVKRYTDYHAQRVYDYQYFLGSETNANEWNKFLMNITEQDMEDFVKGTHMKVRKVSDNDLVGTWKYPSPVNNYHVTFEYRKDHTFTMHNLTYWSDVTFRGRVAQQCTIGGT